MATNDFHAIDGEAIESERDTSAFGPSPADALTVLSISTATRLAEIRAELKDIRDNYRIDGPSQRRRNELLAEGRALVKRS